MQQHDSDACFPNAFFGIDLCLGVIRTVSGPGEAGNQRVDERARQSGSLGDLALAQQLTLRRHAAKVKDRPVCGPPPPHRLMKYAPGVALPPRCSIIGELSPLPEAGPDFRRADQHVPALRDEVNYLHLEYLPLRAALVVPVDEPLILAFLETLYGFRRFVETAI